MPNVKNRTITGLRDHIYDEVETAGITAITRSGTFTGVLISPGTVDAKLAERFHHVVSYNPKHGVQLLIDYIKFNA